MYRFKCCKQSSIDRSANLPLPIAPEEPIKVEETEETETEEVVDEEAKAAEASYKCCGVW